MKQDLKVQQIATSRLIPYARNARTHSEAQVAQIAGSIKEFGFNNPILIDKDNGIIAGHGRVLAAHKLGLDTVPVIVLGHLTENQKRAYILADNKLALNAGWDEEMLAAEIAEMQSEKLDLSLAGFGADEIGELMLEKAINLDSPSKEKKTDSLCCPKCGFRFEVEK